MKKYLYLLLLLLPLGMVSVSCSDDDKLPDVSVQAKISDGVVSDDVIYVVQGESLTIDGITLVNNTGKDAAIGVVNYYLDGMYLGQSMVAPYGFELETDNLPIGKHLLTAEMPVYVVDYPICFGAFSFYVQIVEDASQLPGEAVTTTFTGAVTIK